MKLTKVIEVTSKATTGKAFGQNENKADRTRRMKAFWSDVANAIVHPVGQLLAYVEAGKTLAQHITEGQEIDLTEVSINGKLYPLTEGTKLSLSNVATFWGCPACRSAHGSGVYPSRNVSASHLATNRFFYNPATKQLFTISDSCWQEYVKGLGAIKNFRVPEVATLTPAPESPAPAKGKGK